MKRKLQSHTVNPVGFYSSQVKGMLRMWNTCVTLVTCEKSVKDRNSIKCNLCLAKVHLKWNYLSYVYTQYINFSNITWRCYNFSKDFCSFTTINNFSLYSFLSERFYCNSDSNESCLTIKPTKNLSHLFNEFNSFSSDISNAP